MLRHITEKRYHRVDTVATMTEHGLTWEAKTDDIYACLIADLKSGKIKIKDLYIMDGIKIKSTMSYKNYEHTLMGIGH